jgi:hypothetical protein
MLNSPPASTMKNLFLILASVLSSFPVAASAVGTWHITVIFDGKATALTSALDPQPSTGTSQDLWVTLSDLTHATGFVVKSQGVCRAELCFPLPKNRKSEFLINSRQGNKQWFNLSAFARMLHQPVAYDKSLAIWYFGPRPEVQNNYLSSFQAPNFTLPDMNGKPHSLSDFRGKKVLIVTWASW